MELNRMTTIGDFRNIIKHIQHSTRYTGMDADGDPMYDKTAKMPVITAHGTVKLHGTNAGVSYHKGELYAQSKKNIITPDKDNAGFASFVELNKNLFITYMHLIWNMYDINTNENIITIMGEWAGGSIQKNVAINELPKQFYIFGVKIKPIYDKVLSDEGVKPVITTNNPSYWLEDFDIMNHQYINDNNIYTVEQFDTFDIDIDFNEPLLSQNKMIAMMEEVEKECPVGKFFNINGTGEGIVFSFKYKGSTYRWKVKGDKYAGKSKVKKLKPVDEGKLRKKMEIVNQVTPNWRLVQMYDETFDVINGGVGDIKMTGDYLRALIKDVWKEENDIIAEAGLTSKDINSRISKVGREYFMNRLDEEAGL